MTLPIQTLKVTYNAPVTAGEYAVPYAYWGDEDIQVRFALDTDPVTYSAILVADVDFSLAPDDLSYGGGTLTLLAAVPGDATDLVIERATKPAQESSFAESEKRFEIALDRGFMILQEHRLRIETVEIEVRVALETAEAAEALATEALDAAAAAQATADGKVSKSGDTMTGFLTLHANPTNPNHAATKAYVDSVAGGGGGGGGGGDAVNITYDNTTSGLTAVEVQGALDELAALIDAVAEVSDGDYGDITVSGGGAAWTINAGAVETAMLADLAVTTAKLADGAVETAILADLAVTEAKLADDGVTLAKLEHGTEGDVLYYGAAGAPFRLAKGDDGQVLTLVDGLPAWATFGPQLLYVRDEKATGTDGGDFASGAWQTRVLNTTVINEITGASVASNQITLPKGTYWIEADAAAFDVNENRHKARIQNIADGTTVDWGDSDGFASAPDQNSWSTVRTRLVIEAAKTFELQQQIATTRNGDGFGRASNLAGAPEIFARVLILKVE